MAIAAAQLDQRVSFKREVSTPDGMGGSTSEWTTVATVWGSVRPMRGREREQAQRLNAESNYIIAVRDSVIRHYEIDERCKVTWHDTDFNIRFVPEKARERFCELEVERGVAA